LRVSNPALSRLRLVAIAAKKEKRPGEACWPLRFAISAKCAVLNFPEKDFLMLFWTRPKRSLTGPARQLSPADISRNVRPEPRHAPPGRSINGYVALIADEASGLGVIDHHPKELQVAVAVSPSMRKEASGGLRINQFWPEVLNLAGKNLRSLDGQKPWLRSKTRGVFSPVGLGSYLSQPNRIWVGITNINSEVTMINSLGVKCREHRERESK
jgi:hypothetical protein